MTGRTISVIGAPSSAGAYAPGPDLAPAAWRRHGLIAALERAGRTVRDRGDVEGFRWRPDPAHPQAMNLEAGVRVAAAVADRVEAAMAEDKAVLVLGGDCSVELGTVAGALRGEASTGLIYLDLDVDLNTGEASEGALGWAGVAQMLDLPGAEPTLAGLGPRRPMLADEAVLFLAADNITDGETETIEARGLKVIGLDEVKRDPAGAARRAAEWGARFKRVLVHLDVDVMAFTDFPIAENTRRQAGLTFDELAESLAGLLTAPNWRGLTIAQIDPNHAPDEGEAFRRMAGMVADALAAEPASGATMQGEER